MIACFWLKFFSFLIKTDRVWAVFPALSKLLTDSTSPRLVIMTALDLLQEFINHARVGVVGEVDVEADLPDARSIVVHMPTKVLNRLSDLLYVPRLGPDSLDYIDPVHNIVTRVTTLKLLMSYDATVDTDVRGMSTCTAPIDFEKVLPLHSVVHF